MYLLVHRALRNAGDFLIRDRATRLIATFRPEVELAVADGSRPLAPQVAPGMLGRCRAIVLCGGPGFQNGMARLYPIGEFPDHGPPVVFLALGSLIVPGVDRQLSGFRFDGATRRFLDRALSGFSQLGVRDTVTESVLRENGYVGCVMVGDPAWYDLDRIDVPLRGSGVRKLAFSPPANPAYFHQALGVLHHLERAYPEAAVTIVHHRGVQRPWAATARARGWASVNITGSSAGFGIYDQVDVHVGYRVHAHLYALGRGVVSYLIAEDSRGLGVHRTLGELGAVGFDDRAASPMIRGAMRLLPRIANAHRAATSWLGGALGHVLPLPDIAPQLIETMRADESDSFARHVQARRIIAATLPTMARFIEALP